MDGVLREGVRAALKDYPDIRVSNERFRAVIPADEEEIPVPVPTQTPVDATPRVVVNPQFNAVNVRRCDLVDNDRCPVIGILLSSDTALVQAISTSGTGWFQIQLPSGVVGWVSPTVVTQQGDFSTVGTAQPPTPLPRLSPPEHYATVEPLIRAGAENAGRSMDEIDLAACVWCSVWPS